MNETKGEAISRALQSIKDRAIERAMNNGSSNPYGSATDDICGLSIRASAVPNTRGFSKAAKMRVDWYVDGKRAAINAVIATLTKRAEGPTP